MATASVRVCAPSESQPLRGHAPEQGCAADGFQGEMIESLGQSVSKIGQRIRAIVEDSLAIVGGHDTASGETARNSLRKQGGTEDDAARMKQLS